MRTNLRTGITQAGLVLFAGIALVGPISGLWRQGAWTADDELVLIGFVAGAVFVLRSGLVERRLGALDTFLCANFMGPLQHMLGAILSLLATWAFLCAFTFALALLATAGDLGTSLWLVWVLGLRSALLLPFVLMVESVSTLRVPFFVPALLYLVVVIGMAMALGVERANAILGSMVDRGVPGSTRPLAIRVAIVLPVGFLLVLGGTSVRARWRRRARFDRVPSSH